MSGSLDIEKQAKSPLVSVVIPTYNFGHLVAYTLDSLIAQSFTDWECIVVDDGSVDNTADVVTKYTEKDSRIKLFRQKNSGPALARNTGIQKATGTYLQMLDADDLLQPNKLKYQIEALKMHPGTDVVYGPTFNFVSNVASLSDLPDLKPDPVERPEVTGNGEEVLKVFLRTTIYPSASLMRRTVVMELDMLDTSLKQAEDWDLYLRAAQLGYNFLYLPDTPDNARTLIRHHSSNNTLNFYRLQYYVILMRKKFELNNTNGSLLKLNRQLMLRNLEDLVFEISKDLTEGKRSQATVRSFKLFRLYPSVRYLVYAIGSMFVTPSMYGKIIKFSFKS